MNVMKFEDFEPSEVSFDDFMTSHDHPKGDLLSNEWFCSTPEINHDCFNLFVNDTSSNQEMSIINRKLPFPPEYQSYLESRDDDHAIIFRQI